MATNDDWIGQQLDENRKVRAGVAIAATASANPDTAARANAISRRLGIPADTVERNLNEMEQRERTIRQAQIVQQSPPPLQNWMANPRNAAAVGDDLPALARIGHTVNVPQPDQSKGYVAPTFGNYISGLWHNFVGSLKQSAAGAIEQVADFAPTVSGTPGGYSVRQGRNGPILTLSPQMQGQVVQQGKDINTRAQKDIEAHDPTFSSWWGKGIYHGVASFIQQAPALAASIATGNPGPSLAYAGMQQQTQSYAGYRENNVAPLPALAGSTAQGVVEIGTEFLPFAHYFNALTGRGKGFVRELATSAIEEQLGEQVATHAEDALDTALTPNMTWSDYWAARPEQALNTALATLTQSVISGAIPTVAHLARRRAESRVSTTLLDQVMDDAAQVKLREKDPEAFKQFVEGATQNTPLENVYIPAESVAGLHQDDYHDHPFWGQYASQIDEARQLGGDVVVPLSEAAAHLAGTDDWKALRPEARLSPGGMSEADLLQAQKRYEEQGSTAQERLGQEATKAIAAAEPGAKVYEDIYNKLVEAGQTPKTAAHYATLWAAHREAMGQRTGMDAFAYHQQFPVEFRRAGLATPEGRALEENGYRLTEGGDSLRVDHPHGNTTYRAVESNGAWELVREDDGKETQGWSGSHMTEGTSRTLFPTKEAAMARAEKEVGRVFGDNFPKKSVEQLPDDILGAVTSVAYDAPSNPETGAQRLTLLPEETAALREHGIEIDDDGNIDYKNVETLMQERQRRIKKPSQPQRIDNATDQRGRPEHGDRAPLANAPKVDGQQFGPIHGIVNVAEDYARQAGIPLTRQSEYVKADPAFGKRIADAYEAMQHAPQDPKVQAAYHDLIRQTRAQYDALTAAGYTFEFGAPDDPYFESGWNSLRDLRDNKHMLVFPTVAAYGPQGSELDVSDNPMLADTGLRWRDREGNEQPVLANDLFRAVHDAFGHGIEGAGFRADGEENAWQAHARLFTGPALAALTSETRGQNSWLNFGPHGETNRNAPIEDTHFAEQKTGLLPEWAWTENHGNFDPDDPRIFYQAQVADLMDPDEVAAIDPEGKAIIGWTGQRIDDLLSAYGYSHEPGKTKAYATRMSPDEFLKLTASESGRALIENRVDADEYGGSIDYARMAGNPQAPFLIAMTNPARTSNTSEGAVAVPEHARVMGHEGRHRMTLLKRAGVTSVPVVVIAQDRAMPSGESIDLHPQRSRSDQLATGDTVAKDKPVVPISYANRDRLAQEFGQGRVLFQTQPFYSALERAAQGVSTNRAPAAQWLATLKKAPGVKQEELEWTGLEEWLSDQQQPVTKEEVTNVLRHGAVTVEERVLGEPDEGYREERRQELEEQAWERFSEIYEPRYYVREGVTKGEDGQGNETERENWEVVDSATDEVVSDHDDEGDAYEAMDEAEHKIRDEAEREYVAEHLSIYEEELDKTDAEYPEYSLASSDPVVMGYRELLLHFPRTRIDDNGDTYSHGVKTGRTGVRPPSTHWNAEEGVVAHARFHDRKGPNGERILFLDEIQSDWHQTAQHAKDDARKSYVQSNRHILREWGEQGHEDAAELYASIKEQGAKAADFTKVKALVDKYGDDFQKDDAGTIEAISGYAMKAPQEKIDAAEKRVEDAHNIAEAARLELQRVRRKTLQAAVPYLERAIDKQMEGSETLIALHNADRQEAERARARDALESRVYLDGFKSDDHLNSGQVARYLNEARAWLGEADLPDDIRAGMSQLVEAEGAWESAASDLNLRRRERDVVSGNEGIPDAPFKNTWPMLVMKRMIVWAAENGYDQVAWIKQGENNGGMNDNVGWFYEKVLPNETNKLLKKYGAKTKALKVDGLKPMDSPRVQEINAELSALKTETMGMQAKVGAGEEEARAQWERARQGYQEHVEKEAARVADFTRMHERRLAEMHAADEAGDNSSEHERAAATFFRQAQDAQQEADYYQRTLDASADFDKLWAAAQKYDALEKERDQLHAEAGTNLGFDITPELKSAAMEGFALFQGSGNKGPRGRVSGGLISDQPGPTLIELMDGADLSTVLHETGHVWVEELRRNAGADNAPQDIKDDWQAIADWFDKSGSPLNPDGTIPTEAHELFARGFERYLMEGKAPSNALKRAFDAFRSWLLTIYKHVENLRSPITPEVRRVFDRMLATQDAIDEAANEQQTQVRFENAAQAGMTEAEFAAYNQLANDARSEAMDALIYRTMSGIRRERTKAWREEERRVRDEVSDRVNQNPVYRAIHLLRTGRFLDDPEREQMKLRLDEAWLKQHFGDDIVSRLPKGQPITKEDGDDPDLVANMTGFTSGEDMVKALIELDQRKQAMKAEGDRRSVKQAEIENETQRLMEERHGNPLDDGSIEEEALAAIHNEKQGELIASENRQLARQSKNQPTAYSMAKEWARRKIAEGRVVDVASKSAIQRYARAYAKASRLFEQALSEQNVDEAFRQSEIRLLNHALMAEAKKAADRVETAVDRLSKVAKQRVRKSVAQEYFDRAHALLEKFEFRARSQKALDELENFAAWAQRQADNGIDVLVPPRLDSDGVHYTRMTVEELIGLDDSVQQLLHIGRKKKALLDARDQRDFDEVVHVGLTVIDGIPQKASNNRLNPNRFDKLRAKVRSVDAALLKMEQIFDWLDDDNPNGVFNRHVFQPIAKAQGREHDMVSDYLGKVREHLAAIPREQLRRWEDKISTPLLNRETGQPFQFIKQDLIAMALNVGNEGNFEKLAGGYGWNRDTIMSVLDQHLTPEEWNFVQQTWDLVNKLWPEIEALEKRVNGIAPEKVEPRAFTLANGTNLRGGYYPVVYDPLRNYRTEELEGKETGKLFADGYARATTRQGFTKERTSVQRPIHLSLTVLNRHLTEVIHDITHREAIMQADRFLSDRRIVKAVDDAVGREIRQQFRPWLAHIANEWVKDNRGLDGSEAIAKRLRTSSTIIGMGFRLTTIIAQVAGYAGTMEKIGTRWMTNGVKAVSANPVATYEFVMERSDEVRHRMSTMERDIEANLREMQGKTGLLANVRRFAFHGIGYMDRVVVIPSWVGAYHKGLSEGMDEGDAAQYADKVIRETQGSGGAKDLTRVQRGSEWGKLVTMFYSYAAAFYSRQRSLGRDTKRAVTEKEWAEFPGLLARAWWLMIVSPLLGQLPSVLLSGVGPDEDKGETWGGFFLKMLMANIFYGIPVVRDVATAAMTDYDYSFTPASRAIDTMIHAARDLRALGDFSDDTQPSKKAVKNAIEATGYTLRLPLGQVANAGQFIVDWADGKQDPKTVSDWLEGLQRGKLDEK